MKKTNQEKLQKHFDKLKKLEDQQHALAAQLEQNMIKYNDLIDVIGAKLFGVKIGDEALIDTSHWASPQGNQKAKVTGFNFWSDNTISIALDCSTGNRTFFTINDKTYQGCSKVVDRLVPKTFKSIYPDTLDISCIFNTSLDIFRKAK